MKHLFSRLLVIYGYIMNCIYSQTVRLYTKLILQQILKSNIFILINKEYNILI